MLLQTNSYIVPKDKRTEHARLIMRFRQTLARLGCDHFEAYEQVGANWSPTEATGRFVQIMRFRDRKHQQQVQAAERSDPAAQALIKEFCELINFPYQQQQGLFAVGFYSSILPGGSARLGAAPQQPQPQRAAPGGENGPAMASPPATFEPPAALEPQGPAAPVEEAAGPPPQEPPQPEHESHARTEQSDEPLISPDVAPPAASEPDGEFNIDEFIEEESAPKRQATEDSPGRPVHYEP